jgi:hypothetical protein
MHKAALKFHYGIEYLELRESKSKNAKYVFNDALLELHNTFGGNLKTMKIDCLAYSLSEDYTSSRYPIVERRGVMQVLQSR